MPLGQPQSESFAVYQPGEINHTNSLPGGRAFASVGRPATRAEEFNGGAIGMSISSLNDPLTTYPEAGGIRTMPGAIFANGASFPSGASPPTATGRSRGPLLPVDREDDITRLKGRLLANGASAEAVNLCDEVFKDGITTEILERRLTWDQCKRLDLRDGKQFQIFLEKVEVVGGTKNCCRLCSRNNAVVYKNHRDALRHFLKDHFGLWFECTHW